MKVARLHPRGCTGRVASQRIERAGEGRRVSPGTLEVNVLRMVGRCLVCSRLISTWVSSLELPPSTPPLSLYCSPPPPHGHRWHTINDSPPEQSDSTTTSVRLHRHRHQEACSCTAQSSCPFHMSHLPPPPCPHRRARPQTLRRSVSSLFTSPTRFVPLALSIATLPTTRNETRLTEPSLL